MKKVVKFVALFFALILIAGQGLVAHAAPAKLKVAIVQLVTHPSLDEITSGIKESLASHGYKEGDNLEIDFQNAEGDMNLLHNISEEVVAKEPDLIFAITTPVAQSLQQATNKIPIVLAGITDPVSAKLVTALDKTDANITGVSDFAPLEDLFKQFKSLDLDVKTIGMMYTTSEDNAKAEVEKAKAIAEKLGYKVEVKTIDSTNDMALVAEELASKSQAIFIPTDNTIASSISTLLDVTDKAKIPVLPTYEKAVKEGALLSVAISQTNIGKQSADLGLKIIDGTKISDLPIEFAKETVKVYNGQTADKLGIKLPSDLSSQFKDLSKE